MSTPAPVFDRRQRAREAGRDASLDESLNVDPVAAVEAAIETATRAQVDRDVRAAAWQAHEARTAPMEGPDDPEFVAMLIAAFEAAGFEVEP